MSLFKLCRMGLLTNETTIILNALSTKKDWKLAQEKLFESGYVPSKERANELKNEIRKRITSNLQSLPNLDDLIIYTKKGLSETERRELYYVYLYYSDDSFMHMVDLLRDIDNSQDGVQTVSRDILKRMLIDYQKVLGNDPKEKTIQNWIGRFISILREITILSRKKRNVYIINFGLVSRNNWTFFSLHAYFNNISLIESPFLVPFNITQNTLMLNIKNANNPLIKYNIHKEENEIISIDMDVKLKSLDEWGSE